MSATPPPPARRLKSIRSIHNVPLPCIMLSTQSPLLSPIAIIASSHDRFRCLHRSTHGPPLLHHASISGRCALALRSVSHQSASSRSPQSSYPLLFVLRYIVTRVLIVVYILYAHLPRLLLHPISRYSCICFIHPLSSTYSGRRAFLSTVHRYHQLYP